MGVKINYAYTWCCSVQTRFAKHRLSMLVLRVLLPVTGVGSNQISVKGSVTRLSVLLSRQQQLLTNLMWFTLLNMHVQSPSPTTCHCYYCKCNKYSHLVLQPAIANTVSVTVLVIISPSVLEVVTISTRSRKEPDKSHSVSVHCSLPKKMVSL